MNFLALMVGLGLERLLTQLFHLREFRWLDPLFDWVLRHQRVTQPNLAILAAAGLALLLVVPVGIVEAGLHERFARVPQFLFAVGVLLFCLGPRDLGEQINDYCKAIENGDEDEIRGIAGEFLEQAPAAVHPAPDIERAIYAQANNRIFGVVFWFVLLGPTGAWLFRVLDLMQRRAVYYAAQQALAGTGQQSQVAPAMLLLHRVIAWIPARLLAVGYMLAGSFEAALAAWKELRSAPSAWFPGPSDQLLGSVGQAAAAGGGQSTVIARVRVAYDLVSRTLWMIWCPALAALTLYDLMV
jgi:membrane protein required for beta-lactamase induction